MSSPGGARGEQPPLHYRATVAEGNDDDSRSRRRTRPPLRRRSRRCHAPPHLPPRVAIETSYRLLCTTGRACMSFIQRCFVAGGEMEIRSPSSLSLRPTCAATACHRLWCSVPPRGRLLPTSCALDLARGCEESGRERAPRGRNIRCCCGGPGPTTARACSRRETSRPDRARWRRTRTRSTARARTPLRRQRRRRRGCAGAAARPTSPPCRGGGARPRRPRGCTRAFERRR
mmetsp:Transcript_27758/g.90843  ORF Transcript_27758/g.90843 Transcript_27758/m.90843 type:complete len:231 (+) Transcript_27758:961-1653(+)